MNRWIALAAGSAAIAGVLMKKTRSRGADFSGEVVLITGGSHGLGIALARRFGALGAKLVLCARDQEELRIAKNDLAQYDVLTIVCDVSHSAQVEKLVQEAIDQYGRIDVLVNNAGNIKVGPVHAMNHEDFAEAMDVIFRGTVNTTLAALPCLRKSQGTIVNVTSIGGKVSIPHLLPYCCAKFAGVAFSEGLRAELNGTGVRVVTVAPGLMRTGSYRNAKFKGAAGEEAAWFSLAATMPGISINANRAAKQIVAAARNGKAETVLGAPAKMLAQFHGMFPGLSSDLLGLANRLLPRGERQEAQRWQRVAGNRRLLDLFTKLGARAAKEFLQPGATHA